MRINPRHSRQGFTLIELSIVLVIIGLIIGGVLTGQQIIQNASITNAINSIQAYQGQFQQYAQNNGALPGDDSSATTRFPTAGLTKNGNGDGVVGDGTSFATTNSDDESRLVWADLRAAGLIKNQVSSGSTAVQPTNPFGGIFGFQNGAFGGQFTTTVVCLNKVPASAAQAIDTRIDDGISDKGTIRASAESASSTTSSSAGSLASSYADGSTYTLCARM